MTKPIPPTVFTLNDVLASACCVPDCQAAPLEDAPFPICCSHYGDITRHFWATVRANGYTMDDGYGQDTAPHQPGSPKANLATAIYFVRLADRVKIGITSNVARRLTEIPHDEVLAVIPGTYAEERDWHHRLAEHRIQGEWFRATPALLAKVP